MKTALLIYVDTLKERKVQVLLRTSFSKIIAICNNSDISESRSKKIQIYYRNDTSLDLIIDKVFEENTEYQILPFFRGDVNSPHSIHAFNKAYNTDVDYRVFREKDRMNDFLKDVTDKKNIRFKYYDLSKESYSDICSKIESNIFILKPLNASSSLMNFKITSEEQFNNAISKISEKYDYIIEECLTGNLYATDLFFDGESVFLLCHTREMTFAEILNKFSKKYMDKYNEALNDNFMHFLPVRYTLDLKKIPKSAIKFIQDISKPLKEIGYRGFIHLEYKYDSETKRTGYIEWGARLGGNRSVFIEIMHNIRCEQILYDILARKDHSLFEQKNKLYYLKNRNHDKNIVSLKTNVLEEMYLVDLLKKHPDFLNHSFGDFLRDNFKINWKIKVDKIKFDIRTTPDHMIYPFYKKSETRFDYYMELDEDNYKQFLKSKFSIIEKLVFHDY